LFLNAFQDTMEIRLSSDIGSEIHFELDEADATPSLNSHSSASSSSSASSAASSMLPERDRNRDRATAAAASATSGALLSTDRTLEQMRDDADDADAHSDDEAAEHEIAQGQGFGQDKNDIENDSGTATRRHRADFAAAEGVSSSSSSSHENDSALLHDADGQKRQSHGGMCLTRCHACMQITNLWVLHRLQDVDSALSHASLFHRQTCTRKPRARSTRFHSEHCRRYKPMRAV
jgi:hypothetical protein